MTGFARYIITIIARLFICSLLFFVSLLFGLFLISLVSNNIISYDAILFVSGILIIQIIIYTICSCLIYCPIEIGLEKLKLEYMNKYLFPLLGSAMPFLTIPAVHTLWKSNCDGSFVCLVPEISAIQIIIGATWGYFWWRSEKMVRSIGVKIHA